LLLALSTACTSSYPDDSGRDITTSNSDANSVPQQFAELLKRPDIDEATAHYEQMHEQIRARLSDKFGRNWEQYDKTSASACGFDHPGLNSDGETRRLASWRLPGKLSDSQWDQAVVIIGEVATGYGFDPKPEVVVNQPGDHTVIFHDASNAKLNFGSAVNTVLSVFTGCHLTAEAHRRGTPTPKPTYAR
jgi:hypothetical protein